MKERSERPRDGQGNWRAAIVCALISGTAPAFAQSGALPDHDLSPTIATIGLPRADEGGSLLPAGVSRWQSSVVTASHSTQETSNDESMLFDGETTRVAVTLEYGLSEKLQLGIQLPYLWHESGMLDTAVETWHDWFGLPNGLRSQVPQDQLDFRYQAGGVDLLNVQRNQRGIGDLRLLAGWQLQRDVDSATALRVVLQLPTGDSDRLTGSGAASLSAGIAGDRFALFDAPRWNGFYRAHLVLRARPDRLADRAEPVVAMLVGGLSVAVNARLRLAVQGTLRSAAYDSRLRLLGETALLLNVGGTVSLSDRLQLAVAVGEDVKVNSAPDVSFAVTLRYRPAGR